MNRKRTNQIVIRILTLTIATILIASSARAGYVTGIVLCDEGIPAGGIEVSGEIDPNSTYCDEPDVGCVDVTGSDGFFKIDYEGDFSDPPITLKFTKGTEREEIVFAGDEYEVESVDGESAAILKGPIYLSIDCSNQPCDDCDGKVTRLTLLYTGGDPGIISVEGKRKRNKDTGEFEAPIYFLEDGTNSVETLEGRVFTAIGSDKKGTLGPEIFVYVDGVLDTKIHTSCSQPIGPGLIRGDFKVLGGVSRNGGILCSIYEDCPSADLTNDCFVDMEDLAVMAEQWLTGGKRYDPNDSGDDDDCDGDSIYLKTDKPDYSLDEDIVINFDNCEANFGVWISIAEESSPDTKYITWSRTDGTESGTVIFDRLGRSGNYVARVYFDNNYDKVSEIKFKVKGPSPSVSTSKGIYAAGEEIAVNYKNADANFAAWLSLAHSTSSDGQFITWCRTNGTGSGIASFGGLAPGNYKVRLYFNNSFDKEAEMSFVVE